MLLIKVVVYYIVLRYLFSPLYLQTWGKNIRHAIHYNVVQNNNTTNYDLSKKDVDE